MPVENVVSQHQRAGTISDKISAYGKGVRQAIRTGLDGILKVQSPFTSIAQKLLKTGGILWSRDDQDVAHTRQHERAEWIVNHRLVVNRQQLFRNGFRHGVEPGAGAAGKNDAFTLDHGDSQEFQ